MILFPHMLAGALVGSKSSDLAAIFFGAVFLHFLLDAIPHWDYLKEEVSKLSRKKFWLFLTEAAFDFISGIFIIWLIFRNSYLPYQNIAWGVFGGVLPDGLWFLNQLTKRKNKYLDEFQKIHNRIHYLFKINEKVPLWLGLLTETTIIVILLFLILC